jgi:hypothetical protein
MSRLITRKEHDRLTPLEQGYAVYMQGKLPGSELKGVTNPYSHSSSDHLAWNEGQYRAVLEVQHFDE